MSREGAVCWGSLLMRATHLAWVWVKYEPNHVALLVMVLGWCKSILVTLSCDAIWLGGVGERLDILLSCVLSSWRGDKGRERGRKLGSIGAFFVAQASVP